MPGGKPCLSIVPFITSQSIIPASRLTPIMPTTSDCRPDMAAPYRSTPIFDETSLPTALRTRHSTKAGVWGMVHVLEGQLKLTYLDPVSEILLGPSMPGRLLPEQPHFVEPLGAMKMRVDFYKEPPGG